MIEITTSVQNAVKAIGRIPKMLERAAFPVMDKATDEIKRIMQRPGLPIRYPVRWDSIKQKIFVIAKLRREGNLPYERTGEHAQAWEKQTLSSGYTLSNIGHKAVFLYGTVTGTMPGAVNVTPSGQSHIHENRWRLFRPVLNAVMSRIPKSILERFRFDANA
jgi:hypothetical protein